MSLLRNRNFMLLQTGWSISYLGTQLQALAFSLYILEISGSAMQVAVTLCLQIVPTMLMAPFSGYLADRWDRKRQIVCFDLLSAGVTFLFFVWYVTQGRLPVYGVYLCVLLLAGLQEFTSSASSGLMQAVVPVRDVNAQQAAGSVLRSLTLVAAPAIGGLLYGALGLSAALLGNAVSFLICAGMEGGIRMPGRPGRKEGRPAHPVHSFFSAQREATAYIRRSPFLQSFLVVGAVLNFIVSSVDVGLMVVSQKTFAVSSSGLGAANSAVAVGMTAGALLAGLLGGPTERLGLRTVIRLATAWIAAAFAGGGALLLFGHGPLPAVAAYLLFVACHAVVAGCCGFISVRISSAFQKNVAPRIIGRTSALTGAVLVSAAPLGQVAAGTLLSCLPYAAMYGIESGLSVLTMFFARHMDRNRPASAIIEKDGQLPPADAEKQQGESVP